MLKLIVKFVKIYFFNYKYVVIYLGWTSLFFGGTTKFTIGYSMLMLIIDSMILCLLIFYVDSVFPTDGSIKRHPLFFLEVY